MQLDDHVSPHQPHHASRLPHWVWLETIATIGASHIRHISHIVFYVNKALRQFGVCAK
jgi:hypothetical protein